MAQKKWDIIVPLTAVALLSAILCSCAAPDNGQKLAKDLIAAGFRPMEPFQPRSDDKTKTGPFIHGGSLVIYDNGSFALDEQGCVTRMHVYATRPSYMTDELSPISISTFKSTNMLLLKKKEILSLYGYQEKANALSTGSALHYMYRLGTSGLIHITFSLEGSEDSDKLEGISASYSSDELAQKLLNEGKSSDFYDWPTT